MIGEGTFMRPFRPRPKARPIQPDGKRYAAWRDGLGERQKERFGLDVWSSNPAAMADIRRRMRNARKQERA